MRTKADKSIRYKAQYNSFNKWRNIAKYPGILFYTEYGITTQLLEYPNSYEEALSFIKGHKAQEAEAPTQTIEYLYDFPEIFPTKILNRDDTCFN